MERTKEFWKLHAMAYSFFGNVFLTPLQEAQGGLLVPKFWQDFPFPGNTATSEGLEKMQEFLQTAGKKYPVARILSLLRVTYAQLFMGPPKPEAAPWETVYRAANRNSAVYGEPTYRMQKLLQEAGLQPADNKQLPDHIGMELLYIAAISRQLEQSNDRIKAVSLQKFIANDVLTWYPDFVKAVQANDAAGFYGCLVDIIYGCLQWSAEHIDPE